MGQAGHARLVHNSFSSACPTFQGVGPRRHGRSYKITVPCSNRCISSDCVPVQGLCASCPVSTLCDCTERILHAVLTATFRCSCWQCRVLTHQYSSTLSYLVSTGCCTFKQKTFQSTSITTAVAELHQALRGPRACLQRLWARTTHPARHHSRRAQTAGRALFAAHHLHKHQPMSLGLACTKQGV